MRKIILLCMVVSLAMAVDASAAKGKRWRSVRDQDPTSGLESWYFSFGVGGADLSYPDGRQALVDELAEKFDYVRSKYFVDIGLYSPTNQHTVAGLALNIVGDRHEFARTDANGFAMIPEETSTVQMNQLLIGPSVRRYLGSRVGRGLYIRVDGGLARFVQEDDRPGVDTETTESDWGFGFLGGRRALMGDVHRHAAEPRRQLHLQAHRK